MRRKGRQHKRADAAEPEPALGPPGVEDQLAALIRAIELADEFVLLFAVCNRNEQRRELMQRIREALPGRSVKELVLDRPVENLYHRMLEEFARAPAPDVLEVTGLEVWLPAGEEGEQSPFVLNLNAARNHLPQAFNGALVLWLSDHILDAIAHGAPDFCSVRSGVYIFATAPEEGRAIMQHAQELGFSAIAGLPFEDKQRRCAELEEMLAELADQPEAERDQARERRLLKAAAETYYALAGYNKAEPLLRRLLAMDETALGAQHPEVALDLNNLAVLLKETDRLVEAEPLMRRALAIDEAYYGPDHPKVAIRLNNLANLLQDTNRLGEAEPLVCRALAIDEASYGAVHPKVAVGLNNLAQLLQLTNRLGEAEPLYRRALAIDEASYGPDHPNVARDLNNLASLLTATNRLVEADPLMRRALAIAEASCGPNHPTVGRGLHNLAAIEAAKDNFVVAEQFSNRALGVLQASFSEKHPLVQEELKQLAAIRGKVRKQSR